MLSVDRHIVTADHHSVSEDVADVTLTAGGHVVAVVADGAGGVAHARAAAELVVSSVMRAAERLADEGVAACARLLANLDLAMAKTASLGQCSAVVLVHDGLRSFWGQRRRLLGHRGGR